MEVSEGTLVIIIFFLLVLVKVIGNILENLFSQLFNFWFINFLSLTPRLLRIHGYAIRANIVFVVLFSFFRWRYSTKLKKEERENKNTLITGNKAEIVKCYSPIQSDSIPVSESPSLKSPFTFVLKCWNLSQQVSTPRLVLCSL